MENLNTKPYLEETKVKLFEQLRQVHPVGFQIQTGGLGDQTAPDMPQPEKEEKDPEVRVSRECPLCVFSQCLSFFPPEVTLCTACFEFVEEELEQRKEHPAEFYDQAE